MFAKTIIDSDAFLDMSITARLLYYDLAMRADDEGFVNSPKKIMRMIGASEDDLRMLAMRKFIIPFESGIVVIKHWKIHNYIQSDRFHETKYKDEKSLLALDENKAYTTNFSHMDTGCIQDVSIMDTQVRLGKDSLGKDKDILSGKPEPFSYPYAKIVEYLNEKAGTNYKATGNKTRTLIKARFNDGFTLEDFYKVIDNKVADWQGTDMAQYLRPETLFGTKFEGYLNSKPTAKKKSNGAGNFGQYQQRDIDFDALNKRVFGK